MFKWKNRFERKLDAQTSFLVEMENKITTENRELRRENISLVAENVQLDEKNKELRAELERLEKEFSALCMKLAERDAAIERLRCEKAANEAETEAVCTEFETAGASCAASDGKQVGSDELVRKWRNGEGDDEWRM